MTVEEACRRLCPPGVADAIIKDQGVHWAVVAATADDTVDDPEARQCLRDWLGGKRGLES